MGRPKTDESEYFKALEPYLQRGCSLREAALEAKVNHAVGYELLKTSRDFSDKVEQAQNIPIVMARKVWLKEIQNGSYMASKDYLERKRKKEFSTREEVSNEHDGDITIKVINEGLK